MFQFSKNRRESLLLQLGWSTNKAKILSDYPFVDSLLKNKDEFLTVWNAFSQDASFQEKIQSGKISKDDIQLLLSNVDRMRNGEQIHYMFDRGMEIALLKVVSLCKKRKIKEILDVVNPAVMKPLIQWTKDEVTLFEKFKWKDYLKLLVFVAVYGHYSSGKSKFCDTLENILKTRKYIISSSGMTPDITYYDYYRTENQLTPKPHHHIKLFQIPWYRETSNRYKDRMESDPNIQLKRVANRAIDLNIAIYNPKAGEESFPKGEYDLIIRNPDSIPKGNLW